MNNGGIIIEHTEAMQVLHGTHRDVRVIVVSVKPGWEAATVCWDAACGLVDVYLDAGAEPQALIIDIGNASVRHAYVSEMP